MTKSAWAWKSIRINILAHWRQRNPPDSWLPRQGKHGSLDSVKSLATPLQRPILEGQIYGNRKKPNRIFTILLLCLFWNPTQVEAADEKPSDPEANLNRIGIQLPTPSQSIANYVGATRIGNTLFLSGHLPRREDGSVVLGKLGEDLSVQDGYQAARLSAIALLATLKAEIGDLSKVKRVAKVFGMVNATQSFTDHSKVINGCSDLMVEVFGDKGRHARAACGFSSLPLGAAVEIEMIVEVSE